jgi:hypothetical protein
MMLCAAIIEFMTDEDEVGKYTTFECELEAGHTGCHQNDAWVKCNEGAKDFQLTWGDERPLTGNMQ